MKAMGSQPHLSQKGQRLVYALVLSGLMAFLVGAVVTPERAWGNLLLVSVYLVGVGLGAMFFIAVHYVSGAGWAVALRRVPEAMLGFIWVGVAGVGVVLLVHGSTYPWVEPLHSPTTGAQAFKTFWLDRRFFLLRAAAFITAWLVLARSLVRTSRLQDADGDPKHSRKATRLSALFLVVFAISFSGASFDWLMSLEPEWYSTIFAMYVFAGAFSSTLAAILLLAIWLRRRGPLHGVLTSEHLHDLGKLLFAFSTFWMYIWFSQYMLIWYADIPEETTYFIKRQEGAWAPLLILNLFLNWVVPFFALLSSRAKRNESLLAKVAVVVLVGHWLDLYLLVLPPLVGSQPSVGVLEIALSAGGAAAGLAAFFRVLAASPVIPEKDPLLVQSLHYHSQ